MQHRADDNDNLPLCTSEFVTLALSSFESVPFLYLSVGEGTAARRASGDQKTGSWEPSMPLSLLGSEICTDPMHWGGWPETTPAPLGGPLLPGLNWGG